MNNELKVLVRYRLARATESIDEARLLLNSGHVNTAVNGIYYSAFYAVNGLLLSHGLSSAKHSGVRSLFHQTFVKNNTIDIAWGRLYDKLYDNRQKGDHADLIRFDKKEVGEWIVDVEKFVSLINQLIHFTDEPDER